MDDQTLANELSAIQTHFLDRLGSVDRRLDAIDRLLKTAVETMTALAGADAALHESMKALAKRVDAEIDLQELRTLIP